MSDLIRPFHLNIPDAALTDLQRRIADTRWPESETVEDSSQGVRLQNMKALVEYWKTDYDWRRCERLLNDLGQFQTTKDGLDIHFLHIRSSHSDALPLLITHGWPGSIIEFHKVTKPLTDPTQYGGKASDAFHLILPSLPGYGFSEKPVKSGWDLDRIARAWNVLMERLGYSFWVAQGGDWGSMVTMALGAMAQNGLAGVHLNMLNLPFPPTITDPTPEELAAFAAIGNYMLQGGGYGVLQGTRPQTLAYALTDSPVGQAAWIYEKFCEWTDSGGEPNVVLSCDELLDNIMLYWLPGTGGSSARLYWESFQMLMSGQVPKIEIPSGASIFPHEIFRSSRRWTEASLTNIIHWNELDRGGHFAAFEQPELFVNEIRQCFRQLR